MVDPEEVASTIRKFIPDSQVLVEDMNGGGDHLSVNVISATFSGLSRVQQHQMIYKALHKELSTEAIHALALRTSTH